MKPFTLSTFVLAVIFTACQSNNSSENTVAESSVNEIKPQLTVESTNEISTHKSNAELLMEKSDCYTCHSIGTKLIGPSFNEISKKYENKKDNVNQLVDKIINGGSGVWGEVPMQAHSQLSKEDATEMVNFILSIE
ncbi:MAG: cytochrome C [Bacteroidia bacterium]|nr:cytochrome C [Bacteroidia bacterium]